MAKNRIGMSFKGFEEMAAKFEEIGGNLRPVVTECLEKSQAHIAKKAHADMKKHHRTGRTEDSIVDGGRVDWIGTTASIGVGFNIYGGGLASVFLMYGTPRMKKDTKLYNDVYGTKIRNEIKELQEEIFKKKMDSIMGG